MDSNEFDIVIIGAGLSSYAAIKYLIYKKLHLKRKICIISGRYKTKAHNLKNSEINYLKKFHKVIYDNGNLEEINSDNFSYFKNNNLNLISLKTLGGLGKYWGGGFFPPECNLKNEKIKKTIFNQFKFKKSEVKDYFKIKKTDKKNIKEIDCNFLISSENNFKILDPGYEIENICKKNNIKLIDNCFANNFQYKKKSDQLKINLNNKNTVFTKNLFLAAGSINTPYLLYKSRIIKEKSLLIKDHAMYRIPLFRPIEIIKVLVKLVYGKKIRNKKTISSLKQAFKINISERSIFLGLYALSSNKIKLSSILKFLVESEIIIFSQLYISNEENQFSCKISMEYNKDALVFNPNHLKLKEWEFLLCFFLRNKMIPIPYKFKLPFGSSYHFHGSLIKDNKLINIEELNKRIFIVDNSNLNKIGCEPSSYALIQNTLKNIDAFLEKFNLK